MTEPRALVFDWFPPVVCFALGAVLFGCDAPEPAHRIGTVQMDSILADFAAQAVPGEAPAGDYRHRGGGLAARARRGARRGGRARGGGVVPGRDGSRRRPGLHLRRRIGAGKVHGADRVFEWVRLRGAGTGDAALRAAGRGRVGRGLCQGIDAIVILKKPVPVAHQGFVIGLDTEIQVDA